MQTKGTLFIISAPSGAGKTSLIEALLKQVPSLETSISYTTRPQREGETADESYFFIDNATFDKMITQDKFLEHADVFGHRYGTGKEWVTSELNKGTDVILNIDWQGAQSVRKVIPEAVSIFILPPSLDALRQRLEGRHREGTEDITKRLHNASNEIAHHEEFDYLVINDDFDQAVTDLVSIVLSQRLTKNNQKRQYSKEIAAMLPRRDP